MKLFTKAQRDKLIKNHGENENAEKTTEHKVVVKLFNPVGDVTLISPFSFWSIKSIPAKKIFALFKSLASRVDIFSSILVNLVAVGIAPLLILL